ncbi:hypothetical protein PHYBOEH_004819 [Phytophthora boehmeriae]|uniref:FYVE-type domain-containing protein n=1 Tax=Phytophthora boehmeriae TaxID=109152 RepID=A0A8T1WMT4_9STRA|nr:hypothetical protein PHYBOEH_004819 [Phytophthora boehmeriae]
MVEIVVSERERRDLVRQGDSIFLEVQERLYETKIRRQQRQRAATVEAKDVANTYLTALDKHPVHGSLDEVADLFLNEDKQLVLDFSESRELVVLQPTTKRRPLERTSLRWSILHSPWRHLAKDQDFCYLETIKPYRTEAGRRGWAKCAHSIKHPACPEFADNSSIHVNRGELFYCGMFFEETNEHGVLDATFYYNVKRDNIPPVLLPVVFKSRGKRNAEILNHYIKTAQTMLYSKKQTLTMALQLQADKCCGACSNQLSLWRPKDKCLFCGSFMCEKCIDIVSRNHRVDGVKRGQIVCYSCADRRGSKTMLPLETVNGDGESCSQQFPMDDSEEDRLRDFSLSSLNSGDSYPKGFDDKGKPSLLLAKQEPAPTRNEQFIPCATLRLPTDNQPRQFKPAPLRRKTRVSFQQPPRVERANSQARQRSRTTGNSRLSSRARSTLVRPAAGQESKNLSPTYDAQKMEEVEADPADLEQEESKGLNLEELNYQMRRHTTIDAVPVPKDWIVRGSQDSSSHTTEGTRHHQYHNDFDRAPPLSPTSMRYSKKNPCDLSYLANFK